MRDPIKFATLISYITTLRGSGLNDYDIQPIATLIDTLGGSQSVESVDRLLSHMAAGRKIEAIKEYRIMTGAGLKDSKDAVERYWTHVGHADAA